MARLFIAVDLPDDIREKLHDLVPHDASGVRRVPKEQMHLTLHFIGEGEVERFAPALAEVRAGRFELNFGKLGSFKQGRGNKVIWVGIQSCEGLMHLHRATAEALRRAGCLPDTRPFTPHVTLARLRPEFPREKMKRWLEQEFPVLPVVKVQDFCLYSSVLSAEGAQHTRERVFPLG